MHGGVETCTRAASIRLAPMMAAFILLQRYVIAGLTAGAVKG